MSKHLLLGGSLKSLCLFQGKSKSPLNAAKRKKTLPIQRDMNELDLIDDDVSLQQVDLRRC